MIASRGGLFGKDLSKTKTVLWRPREVMSFVLLVDISPSMWTRMRNLTTVQRLKDVK